MESQIFDMGPGSYFVIKNENLGVTILLHFFL